MELFYYWNMWNLTLAFFEKQIEWSIFLSLKFKQLLWNSMIWPASACISHPVLPRFPARWLCSLSSSSSSSPRADFTGASPRNLLNHFSSEGCHHNVNMTGSFFFFFFLSASFLLLKYFAHAVWIVFSECTTASLHFFYNTTKTWLIFFPFTLVYQNWGKMALCCCQAFRMPSKTPESASSVNCDCSSIPRISFSPSMIGTFSVPTDMIHVSIVVSAVVAGHEETAKSGIRKLIARKGFYCFNQIWNRSWIWCICSPDWDPADEGSLGLH